MCVEKNKFAYSQLMPRERSLTGFLLERPKMFGTGATWDTAEGLVYREPFIRCEKFVLEHGRKIENLPV